MSSPLVTRRIPHPDIPDRRPALRPPQLVRSATTGAVLPTVPRKSKHPAAAIDRFVIALVPRNDVPARQREKRYLARRGGRTFFVSDPGDAMIYPSYKTAYMIGIKAAVHYGCVACIEQA